MNDLPVFLQMFIRFFAFLVIGAGLLGLRGTEPEKAPEANREQCRQHAPAKIDDKDHPAPATNAAEKNQPQSSVRS